MFEFRLALAMGEPNVDLLMDSITEPMLRRWIAYFSREPWGYDVEWFRVGTVAAMVGNASPNRRKGAKAFEPADFIPKMRAQTPPARNPQEFRMQARAVFGAGVKLPARKKGPKNGGQDQDQRRQGN